MSISVLELVCFVTAAAAVWLWMDSLRVRELAIQAARAACVAEGMMLLDDTIAISSLKPVRNSDGRVVLQRAYDFDYTDNGNNRIKGGIVWAERFHAVPYVVRARKLHAVFHV